MNSICVFCGSRSGNDHAYSKQAQNLAYEIVDKKLTLVYGGGKVGLMGIIADAVLKAGGTVVGIIPEFLYNLEVGHEGLTKLIIVDSMHERKQKMAELSDGFIAMPGGFGTLEEIAEIITWNQLDLIKKPMGFLNVNGYYDNLIAFYKAAVTSGFIDSAFAKRIFNSGNPKALLRDMMENSNENDRMNLAIT